MFSQLVLDDASFCGGGVDLNVQPETVGNDAYAVGFAGRAVTRAVDIRSPKFFRPDASFTTSRNPTRMLDLRHSGSAYERR